MSLVTKLRIVAAALVITCSATAAPLKSGKHSSGMPFVRVIVSLKGRFLFEGELDKGAVKLQRELIRQAQDRIIATLGASTGKPDASVSARVTHRYTTVPGLGLELTPDALAKLSRLPDVDRVFDDFEYGVLLDDTTGLMLTDARRANLAVGKRRGRGQVVAVLDTGIDRYHRFLGTRRFVASACFSDSSWFGDEVTSLYPNGDTRQIGDGAGENCLGNTSCRHGTHVAGIIGGFEDGNGNQRLDLGDRAGVAPSVRFVSIQVFHRVKNEDRCAAINKPSPCLMSSDSAMIAGLDHVELLKAEHNIVAVNMSLGGGRFTDQRSCDDAKWLMKWAIDDLRSQKIATIVASGNGARATGGFVAGLASPSCISSAISVGNTRKDDTMNSNSQTGAFLSLLAPGTNVTSSEPGSAFRQRTGTSMAAPHVAGAWAVLREERSENGGSISVAAILEKLSSTGKPIRDRRIGATIPRIDLVAALGVRIVSIQGPATVRITTNGTITYKLDRKNFDGPLVVLASIVDAAPGDFELTVEPSPAIAEELFVRISHASDVGGTYKLRLTGEASGVRVFAKETELTVDARDP